MTLSVQNVSFRYDKRLSILHNISFEVKKGEFIGIFGPNGGGKTTLLRLLLGLLTPESGIIQVAGGMSYVPQMRRFDKQFPILAKEVVLQGRLCSHKGYGGFSSKDKEIAQKCLERVGMGDQANTPFGKLSGGQLQRTLIARALASEPEILLLDEATVGIDPEAFKEIFRFLLTLRKEITIFLVTHELQAIAGEMDRLFCIKGDLTSYSPKEVCEHYALGLYHPPLMKKEKDRD